MNYSRVTLLTIIAALLCISAVSDKPAAEAISITNKMIENSNQIQTLRYTLTKKERINGAMTESKTLGKVNTYPYKIYMKKLEPEAGLELLYVTGANNNKVLINPNSFPWVNVSLEPTSSRMRKGQHHTIFDASFSYFSDIAEGVLKRNETEGSGNLKMQGMVNWKGMQCYHLVQENPDFKFIPYQGKKGETIVSIAKERKISDHMILEKNAGKISSYDEDLAGKTLQIPNTYCRKMDLYVSKEHWLPVFIRIADDKGLYEEYSYENIQVNTHIAPEEFTPKYKDYKF
jgi:outer membrane lipoprotein-sorting protein